MAGTGSLLSPDVAEARRHLFELLKTAYGSAEEANSALQRALHVAHRAELPATVAELLTFVRSGLLPILSEDLGPRLTMSLLDDFVAQQEIRSGIRPKEPPIPPSQASAPPTPVARIELATRSSARVRRLRVLLVGTDRIALAAPARALLRDGHEVTVVASLEELGQVVRSGDSMDVALLDDRHPARLVVMELVLDRFPAVALVVRCAGKEATRALLGALGATRFEVVDADVSSEAMVDAIRKVAAAAG